MSSGPTTTTDTSTKTSGTTKTKEQIAQEQLALAQQLGTTSTQNSGQTATQNTGQTATQADTQTTALQQGQTGTQNIGQTATQNLSGTQALNTGTQLEQNVGQTTNAGQQATQQQGQTATQNLGQEQTQNIGSTTGVTQTQGLAAAQPMLQQILDTASGVNTGLNPTENAALTGLTNQAATVAGFNPQIQALAADQLAGGGFGAGAGGVNSAWDAANNVYGAAMNPDMTGENNPYLKTLLDTIQNRVRNDVGGQFANAGRSFSGAHAGTVADRMSQALADPLFQNYWRERDAQVNAAQGLQTAALARSGELDRIKAAELAARGQGAETLKSTYDPYTTALNAGGYSAQQPIERLGMLGNIATGIANTGGTTNTAGNTVNTGIANTANTGLTNTQQQGLASSQDIGTTQNLGMLNTANTALSNTANVGLTNTAEQGLTNTQQYGITDVSQQGLNNTTNAGLTNTLENGLVNTNQIGTQLSNLDALNKTKTNATGTTNSTGTQTQQTDPFQTATGLLLGGAGILLNPASEFGTVGGNLLSGLSDRRAKEDIVEIGSTFDGLPIYRFRYKGTPTMQIGLMADDVEKRIPEAVTTGPGGFKMVNYKLATEGALQ